MFHKTDAVPDFEIMLIPQYVHQSVECVEGRISIRHLQ
jgi:hypothetical protein